MEDKFTIKNEYLVQAMWGGYLIDNCCFKYCNGYFNYDDHRLGRQFLEYCYSVIFGIHIVPGFETGYKYTYDWFDLNKGLNPDIIADACKELKELY